MSLGKERMSKPGNTKSDAENPPPTKMVRAHTLFRADEDHSAPSERPGLMQLCWPIIKSSDEAKIKIGKENGIVFDKFSFSSSADGNQRTPRRASRSDAHTLCKKGKG